MSVTREHLARLAEAALAGAGDGTQLHATAWHERSRRVDVSGSTLAAVRTFERTGLDVLAVVDGHTARAAAASATPEAAADAAARARAAAATLAAAAGAPGRHPGVAGPATPRGHHGFDAATARLADDLWRGPLDTALATLRGAGAAADGWWEAGVVTTAVAATSGLRLTDATTDARIRLAGRGPTGGIAERAAPAAGALDVEGAVREAIAWDRGAGASRGARAHEPRGEANEVGGEANEIGASAHEPRGEANEVGAGAREPGGDAHEIGGGTSVDADATVPLAPGSYFVVLGPDAVAAVLDVLGRCAFNGLLHAQGRGALSGRLGSRVAVPAINLSDTPRFRGTLAHAFDADGVPKAPLPLIQDGVAHRVVHDLRSAALAGGGTRSTGHALVPGGAPGGPEPRNFVLLGGGAADEHELAAAVERGAYLPRLDAVAVLDLATSRFTAVAGPGAQLIDAGRIAAPLEPVRVTAEALGILAATEALTSGQRLVGRVERFDGGPRWASGSICPGLRAHGVRLAGLS